MKQQKKSALTAGTAIDANEILQRHSTSNSRKTQDVVEKLFDAVAKDAYKRGYDGEAYCADWGKKWKACFGSEPEPKIKLVLEATGRFMEKSYENGKKAALAENETAEKVTSK